MYDYAMLYEIVDKDYSAKLKINIPDDDEHGVPFTDQELRVMWENTDNPCIEMILIMCYSGFRVSAYKTMEINFENNYFKGGVKTTQSKDRIVPIHSAIIPLVKNRLARDGKRMLGHAFQDLTNAFYGHRDPEDLRHEIEKNRTPDGINICY